MLEVVVSERLDVLVRRLAAVYAVPPADPFAPEWIVVPSIGLNRWMRLELASVLGASGPDRSDGVAANISRLGPHAFRRRLLVSGEVDRDPWRLAHLTWQIAEVLADSSSDGVLGRVATLPAGASLWSRSRHIASLFDRYHGYRPEMIMAWLDGVDVAGVGDSVVGDSTVEVPLPERLRWQPELWRRLRERIDVPSPPERFVEVIEDLRVGRIPDGVPERIALFGLTDLPGGASFGRLIEALATQRDVHVYLGTPSLSLLSDSEVSERGELSEHPLLRTWARTSRDTLYLVGSWAGARVERVGTSDGAGGVGDEGGSASPKTLLARIQADLASGRVPDGGWRQVVADRSVRIHRCHGESRQVEVLRDELLHLLATSGRNGTRPLTEDDIVVLCPDIDTFRPAIEALWGPSADQIDVPVGPSGGALRYNITEGSLASRNQLVDALVAVVELAASRFSAVAVLDLVSHVPVRERFGFDDNALERLAYWIDEANTRWGIDGEHRSRWGLPAEYDDCSLMMLVDRLLIGVAAGDDPVTLAIGELLPLDVEGDSIGVAGKFAELILRMREFVVATNSARVIGEWVELLSELCGDLFATNSNSEWQQRDLAAVFNSIVTDAGALGGPDGVEVGFDDLRMVLGRQVESTSGRGAFYRGGVTVCPPTSLAGVPFEVVALLGLDEAAFSAPKPEGDDLMILARTPGDPDRRNRVRQALVDAVGTAGTNLVITHSGHSVVTNQEVPPSVVLAEFEEVLVATLGLERRDEELAGVAVVHPRQAYDERNFVNGGVDAAIEGPWSFDVAARDGARRDDNGGNGNGGNGNTKRVISRPVAETVETVDLLAVAGFVKKPVETFLKRVRQFDLEKVPDDKAAGGLAPLTGPSGMPLASAGENLVIELDHLERWGLADRLLRHLRSGSPMSTFARRERAGQHLGPGVIFDEQMAAASNLVGLLMSSLDELGIDADAGEAHRLAIDLGDSRTFDSELRLVGTVEDARGTNPGPVLVTPSKYSEHLDLRVWLDLLALTVVLPQQRWCGTVVAAKPPSSGKPAKTARVEQIFISGDDCVERETNAREALGVVVDLYLRGRLEALPIFKETSYALGRGRNGSGSWSGGFGDAGDRHDPAVQFAFGDLEYEELIAIPVTDSDPPGTGTSRVERYADLLWGTYRRSVTRDGSNNAKVVP